MASAVEFDAELIRRYDVAGPRYTSYPTVPCFREDFTAADYIDCAQAADNRRPLSLYFHLPFCATLCFYCACNKVVTKNRAHADPYLERLGREIDLQAGLFASRPAGVIRSAPVRPGCAIARPLMTPRDKLTQVNLPHSKAGYPVP